MINEKDIQLRLLVSDNLSLHNEVAHLRERMSGCVSREIYESKCAECDRHYPILMRSIRY